MMHSRVLPRAGFVILWSAGVLGGQVACAEPRRCQLEGASCPKGQFCDVTLVPRKPSTKDYGDEGRCVPLPTPPNVVLDLPIPAGESLYCAKGSLRTTKTTHHVSDPSTRFALDLTAGVYAAPKLVLAPADGKVYWWGGCPSRDLDYQEELSPCNYGFGNLVRIEHEPGLYSQAAHLSAILVEWGDTVKRGDPIGIEGNSGNAGAKHIHFSLHRGDPTKLAIAATVPMLLRTSAGVTSSLELRCGDFSKSDVPDPQSQHLSANKLRPKPMRFGFAPNILAALLRSVSAKDTYEREQALRRLENAKEAAFWTEPPWLPRATAEERGQVTRALDELTRAKPAWLAGWVRLVLARIWTERGDPTKARALLEQPIPVDADEAYRRRYQQAKAEHQYWAAVKLMDQGTSASRAQAAEALTALLKAPEPPWLGRWCRLRLASIWTDRGEPAKAREYFEPTVPADADEDYRRWHQEIATELSASQSPAPVPEQSSRQEQAAADAEQKYWAGVKVLEQGTSASRAQAVQTFEALLKEPDPPWLSRWSRLRLAILWCDRGEPANARTYFDQAIPPDAEREYREWHSKLRARLARNCVAAPRQ